MIDPSVRPAEAADHSQLDALEVAAREALVGQRGGDRWLQVHPPRSPRWSGDPAATTFVAHIDDVLVGHLVVTVAPAGVERVATVEQVWVDPDARELGFGDALLEAALDHARAAGVTVFEGEALPGDRQTKNLYERAAITARLITVSTRLS